MMKEDHSLWLWTKTCTRCQLIVLESIYRRRIMRLYIYKNDRFACEQRTAWTLGPSSDNSLVSLKFIFRNDRRSRRLNKMILKTSFRWEKYSLLLQFSFLSSVFVFFFFKKVLTRRTYISTVGITLFESSIRIREYRAGCMAGLMIILKNFQTMLETRRQVFPLLFRSS